MVRRSDKKSTTKPASKPAETVSKLAANYEAAASKRTVVKKVSLGPPDAKQLFGNLFEAQWGIPKKKREELLARMIGIGTDKDVSNFEAMKAFDSIIEAQKLDLAAAKIMVDGVTGALGASAKSNELPILSDEQLDERLALIAERVDDEPVPVPIRRGRPQLLSEDDEYEVAQ